MIRTQKRKLQKLISQGKGMASVANHQGPMTTLKRNNLTTKMQVKQSLTKVNNTMKKYMNIQKLKQHTVNTQKETGIQGMESFRAFLETTLKENKALFESFRFHPTFETFLEKNLKSSKTIAELYDMCIEKNIPMIQKIDTQDNLMRNYAISRKDFMKKKKQERNQSSNTQTKKDKETTKEDKETTKKDKESGKEEKVEEGKEDENKKEEKPKRKPRAKVKSDHIEGTKSKTKEDQKEKEKEEEEEEDEEEEEEQKTSKLPFILYGLAVCGYIIYREQSQFSPMDWEDFERALLERRVNSITIHDEATFVTFYDGSTSMVKYPHDLVQQYLLDYVQRENDGALKEFTVKVDNTVRLATTALSVNVNYSGEHVSSRSERVTSVIYFALTIGLLIYIPYTYIKSMRNTTKSGGRLGEMLDITKKKSFEPVKVDTNFKDVAGLQEAKMEVMEFVDFLKNPDRFTQLGARIPKGALLEGPPGTGKTLLAKAVAGEADVPFFSISGSEFVEMIVGVGPKRVRELFQKARENSPAIIFIDEIDAVGQKRVRGAGVGRNDERENTVNQILVEMDGFKPAENIVVLAATNRKSILDDALMRPGRFDRQIEIGLPDRQGREEIYLVHMRKLKLLDVPEKYANSMAVLTPGVSGADIMNICNEAALNAGRNNREIISLQDFEIAVDKTVGGLEKKKRILSNEERNFVAHHEAGHATAGWFLDHCDPLLKVSIVPRNNGALGYAQYLPREKFIRTYDEILDTMCLILGGRAAEEIMFGHLSTGASDDLNKVTQMAYDIVLNYGMNERIGHVSYPKGGSAFEVQNPFSEATAVMVDQEVNNLVKECYTRTVNLLRKNKEGMIAVAERLLEKDKIGVEDMVELLGKKVGGTDDLESYIASYENAKKEEIRQLAEFEAKAENEKKEKKEKKEDEDKADADEKKDENKDDTKDENKESEKNEESRKEESGNKKKEVSEKQEKKDEKK